MKIYDQYINLESITVRGSYGRVIAVIPPGTRGCIYRIPTKQYPDPCFEVVHEEQWYSVCVKKDILKVQKGNGEVQRWMALCPAIQRCINHTEHNIRTEVSAVNSVLSHFFLLVHNLRFVPSSEIKQAFGALRQDTAFRDSIEQEFGVQRESDWWRVMYEVSLGHHEYLLRMLDHFLLTETVNEQLCWFLNVHKGLAMHDKTLPRFENAAQMTQRVAWEQSSILVDQEKMQADPYPMIYATYIISELIYHELFQARYSYRDIPYEEQERIAKDSLIAAGYYEVLMSPYP